MSDLISRQAAIDCEYQVKTINDIEYVMLSEVQMKMRKLPSAQPETHDKRTETHACDLISRQAAIENSFEVYTKEYGWCEVVGVDAISELPSAQPEIIRCKDCKYQDENWRRVSVRWLPCMDVRTGSNWYCGSAERGEQDE